MPLRILRSEGVVLPAAALAAFSSALDEPFWLVPLLLFVPLLFMAGYARSTRTGAALYDLAHSYPAPALLGTTAVATSNHLWEAVGLRSYRYRHLRLHALAEASLGPVGRRVHGAETTSPDLT